jgi:hemolysin D
LLIPSEYPVDARFLRKGGTANTIHAKVTSVSSDAVNDEQRGLVFLARIALDRATIRVENKTVNLSPGMAVTVEIKTAQRRVVEYFLSPLMQYKDESLRER